jgi:O-6-methylguanine DNA methyltransferase
LREYKSITKNIIATTVITTPLGKMFVASTNKGICMLTFYNEKNIQKQIEKLKKFFDADVMSAHNKHFDQLKKELDEYFEGKREVFEIPLQLLGTPFQQKVWNILQAIPYGNTISYQEQAVLINNEKAVRAVANANAANLIAIIIPCHRVIGKNGKLTGYAGGIDKKEFLLNLEKNCMCQH